MSWPTIISEKLKHFVTSDVTSDATLIVGVEPRRKEFRSHRFLLSMFSDVFKAMFYGPLADTKRELEFPEDDPDTFQRMIKYIYTGDEGTESSEDVIKLCRLADKYLILELKTKCTDYLHKQITSKSVIQIYEMASEVMEHRLRLDCWTYILGNTEKVLQAASFIKSKISTIKSIISKFETDIVSELIVYNAVLRWGNEECKKEGKEINPSNVRQVIDPLLPLVRFLAMTAEEFCEGPGKDKILTETEQLSTLKGIITKSPGKEYNLNKQGRREDDEDVDNLSSKGSKKVSPTSCFPTISQLSEPFDSDTYISGVTFYLSTSEDFKLPNIKECTLTICNIDRNLKIVEVFKELEEYNEECTLYLDEPFFVAKNERCEITLKGENSVEQPLHYCSGDCQLPFFGKSEFHFHEISVYCM